MSLCSFRSTAGNGGDGLTSHRIRASLALICALLAAAILQFCFVYIAALNISDGSIGPPLWSAFHATFAYGLPLGLAAVLVVEFLRIRGLPVQMAIGTFATFAAAYLATRGEPLTSYVFTGGPLTAFGLAVSGVVASVVYWGIAGRRAGWRGDEMEKQNDVATRTFQRASEQRSPAERCRPCIAAWAAASALAFALFAWIAIDGLGLRDGLVADAEREARTALKISGHGWANFDIAGSRGTLEGDAPDELEKRMAHDITREVLYAVTGFPGVVSGIDDKAAAQAQIDVGRKLAEVQQRELAAQQALEDARRAAAAAQNSVRNEPPDGEALTASIDAAATAREVPAPVERPDIEEIAGGPDATAPTELTGSAQTSDQTIAAVDAVAPSAEDVGASARPPTSNGTACTEQDIALVESSRILFQPKSFQLAASDQRELGVLAASVQLCSDKAIKITGQSDANADSLFNPALSVMRAWAVRDALVARGVNATRIATDTIPLALVGNTEDSTEERRLFRRAHLKFIDLSELSRDAAQGPDERASNCESDLSEIMSQSIIHFPIASARVSEESSGLIRKLADAIQNCGSVIVTVEGHTDKIGTPERNQQLSIARATAVRMALASAGADPTRLASRGFASSRPMADEETAEAYALNRRIEFKVSGKFTTENTGGP